MPETAQPTGAQPTGTSSTPVEGAQPTAVTPSVETKPTEPAKAAEGAKPTEPAKPVEAKPPETKTEPTKTEVTPPADAPLFKLPEDMQLAPETVTRFETMVKGKLKDGALQLTPQDLVDLYAGEAREAYKSWEQQIVAQDQAWKTESEKRFNKDQLAAAETGVGFLSSFDPQFRELTKGIANHPAFVNVMRVIGERLSEDTFQIEGARPPAPRRNAADVLYGKRN